MDFVNVDAADPARFPFGLDENFNVLFEGLPSGLGQRLTAAVQAANNLGDLDWPVVDGKLQVRDVSSTNSNRVTGALGQALGFSLSTEEACLRCQGSSSSCSFSSCRVSAFTLEGRGEVVCLGSCMNCLFSGVASRCSLRVDQPDAASSFLREHVPGFQYRPSAPSGPVTPRQSTRNKRPRLAVSPEETVQEEGEPTEGVIEQDAAGEQVVVEEQVTVEESEVVVHRGPTAVEAFTYNSVLTPELFNAPSEELAALSQQILVRRAHTADALQVMDADLRALSNRLEQLAVESVRRGARPSAPWNS